MSAPQSADVDMLETPSGDSPELDEDSSKAQQQISIDLVLLGDECVRFRGYIECYNITPSDSKRGIRMVCPWCCVR